MRGRTAQSEGVKEILKRPIKCGLIDVPRFYEHLDRWGERMTDQGPGGLLHGFVNIWG